MSEPVNARTDPPPPSAVSHGVGLAGLAGLGGWYLFCVSHVPRMDGPYAAAVAVIACALPMLLWSVLVDGVHRRSSTGIAWERPAAPFAQTRDISFTKLIGLWCTWAIIAAFYCLGRWYWVGQYRFAMQVLALLVPLLIVGSIPYVMWIDRRLAEPRDGAWHFGLWLTGRGHRADRQALADHARSWAVKAFFTAFMIAIVPGNWASLVNSGGGWAGWTVSAMFLIDVVFATVGYLLTMRPLDSHIRSANPYLAGWTAALICYPPFMLMGAGGPLDYRPHGADWSHWLGGHGWLTGATGLMLAALAAVYAWATMAFGLRFSNLTDRGILTHGPYRWTKHPAYLSKNLFWWIAGLPFLVTAGGWVEAARNVAALAGVSGIYYWRARTEERHLAADPAYRAYADWMERNAPLPRMLRAIGVRRGGGGGGGGGGM